MSLIATNDKVQAIRTTIVLPTYPIGEPNVNPIINTYRFEKPYPYAMYDRLHNERVDMEYEALVLENAYLKITVLPKLGGKLYAALDKRNNRQLFYHNQVVKPQLVGLTGAWTSGGIEFNFPRAHRPSTMEQIETDIHAHEDGTASIYVGEIDKSTGLRFTVELKLYPDRAYIEQKVHIANPTPLPQRGYFWNTASYPETDELECVYPAKWAFEEFNRVRTPWPFQGGSDIRWCSKVNGFASIFTSAVDEDFFGVYDNLNDCGSVHVAHHREVPGKKYWAWGRADIGVMWNRILTDNDGPYMEYQAGNVQTQAEFTRLQPYQSHNWNEYWFQTFGTGKFTFASKQAVAAARFGDCKRDESGTPVECPLTLTLLMNETHPRATLRVVHSRAGTLFSETRDWDPSGPVRFCLDVPASAMQEGATRLQLVAADGEFLIDTALRKAKSVSDELFGPPEIQKQDDVMTVHARLFRAESRQRYGEAEQLLDELLRSNPDYLEAYVRKAVIQLHRLDKQGAYQTMEKALRMTPLSDEVLYFAGVANYLNDKLVTAKPLLVEINDASIYSSQASILLGKIALREGEAFKALQYFVQSSRGGRDGTNVDVLQAYTLRILGMPERAERLLRTVLERDPLHLAAAAELELLTGQAPAFEAIRTNVHNLLHILDLYIELQDKDVQRRLLERFEDQEHPLVLIHLGSLEYREGNRTLAAEHFATAEQMSSDGVFPTLPSTLAALADAVSVLGEDAVRCRYYAGLIFHSRERFELAEQEWAVCAAKKMEYSVLYRNLGVLLIRKDEKDQAIEILERGLPLSPFNSDIRLHLNTLYKAQGSMDKRLSLVPAELTIEGLDDSFARILITIYNDSGQFDRSLELFTFFQFRAWEIEEQPEYNLKLLYQNAYIGRAKLAMQRSDWAAAAADLQASFTYPENTQLARSAEQNDAEAWYWLAVCREKQGEFAEAIRYCDLIASTNPGPDSAIYGYYVKACAKKVELEWLGYNGAR